MYPSAFNFNSVKFNFKVSLRRDSQLCVRSSDKLALLGVHCHTNGALPKNTTARSARVCAHHLVCGLF